MATLKGQNFRILTLEGTVWQCVGMATNCTVTLTGNTEDASTKDDVSNAAKPTVVSKSWQVSVESMDVADAGKILQAIRSLQPFTLLWDETISYYNQEPIAAPFARKGEAYLSDVSFSFNDRENSTKSLQFTGSGALEQLSGVAPVYTPFVPVNFTKGQYIRLFLGSDNTAIPDKVIACAKSLTLHVSMSMEDATTKDTTGDWQVQEPVGLSYDISTSALMRSDDVITSSTLGNEIDDLMAIYEASDPVKWQIANVSGANNRTKGRVIVEGSVILTSLTLNGPNRQNATYDAQLNGYGIYDVIP